LEVLSATIQLLYSVQPRAVLVENLPELATGEQYAAVRESIARDLEHLGYRHRWFVLNASDHGVPQDRKQGIMVAFKGDILGAFVEPLPDGAAVVPTVGELLGPSMASNGWTGWAEWAATADEIAPTVVGGSWKRGGPDLGPSGSKKRWARLGVDGATIGDDVPGIDFSWNPALGRHGMVRLTLEQVAMLQSFPAEWRFAGGKTAQYRQIANASPPPVAHALGVAIRQALEAC
jgi:DNA (cytosine-5)-methyltransferase 1